MIFKTNIAKHFCFTLSFALLTLSVAGLVTAALTLDTQQAMIVARAAAEKEEAKAAAKLEILDGGRSSDRFEETQNGLGLYSGSNNEETLVKANGIIRRIFAVPEFLVKGRVSGDEWDDDDDEDDEEDDEEDEDDDNDCDNGDDDDDGSQWHKKPIHSTPHLSNQPRLPRFSTQVLAPFPQWLAELTNMSQWPAENVPYIPQPGIDLSNIPNVPLHQLGDCSQVTLEHCSFDCFRCLALDEIMSCPVLSQTFDDGPTLATLTLLENLQSKTTFFTQGINVVKFPDIFRQQHAQGHLLASHTWSHANLAGSSNEQVAAQIQWSIWAMNATAGVVPRFFRPPYGASDNRVRAIARQFGLVSVFWDHDTFDWQVINKKKDTAQILDEVNEWKRETPNGLILEHDSTIDTVNVGIDVSKILDEKQYTVADCVNGKWYQNN